VANGKTHLSVCTACGVTAALYAARDQTGGAFIGKLLGGAVGGAVGGALPDILEPAIHSWHRSTAHSLAAASVLGATAIQSIPTWQRQCRINATHHDYLRVRTDDGLARIWHATMALLWRFLSGFAAGLPAGYLSHLGLDACTPRCIPLLT
jgi:membrane-bound metal-dependent hydrolase YbcI (DUF457 family)